MTYKRFQPFFEPDGFEHRALANIHKGELTEVINDQPNQRLPLIDRVDKEVRRWRSIHNKNAAYVEITAEQAAKDVYVLQAFLTTAGVEALTALSQGYVWSREERKISLAKTAEYYDRDMKRGHISETKAQALLALARVEPGLRETRARFVYLRMQSDLAAGIYRRRPPTLAA